MPAIDIKIDQTTRDIVVTNGLLEMVEGIFAGAQRIFSKLHTFAGEWFLDLSHGIPYKRSIFIASPQIPTVSGILKAEILDSADEGSIIDQFDLTQDKSTRVLDVQGSVIFPGEDESTDISQPVGI